MSAHETAAPARERVISAGAKPLPPMVRQVSIALALLGLVIFLYGVFTGNDRAWHAFHVNWLFFTTISSAAVMFAAVQRITTARWSRGIIRFSEGFVAFLPLALIGLVVMVLFGRSHVYPWWNHLAELPHEKQVYLGHRFFAIRTLLVFTLLATLQVWYIWTSVRWARCRRVAGGRCQLRPRDCGRACVPASGKSVASSTRRIHCRGSWRSS